VAEKRRKRSKKLQAGRDAAKGQVGKTSDLTRKATGKVGGAAAGAKGAATAAASGVQTVSGKASGTALTGAASRRKVSGWTRFLPPNARGKFPWRKRWLGLLPLVALAGFGGWWAWDHMEDQLHERALVHLACEDIDGNDLELDWSYRDVDVDGELRAGLTPALVRQVIDNGSDNRACLEDNGIDPDEDPGVYDVDVAGVTAAAAVAAVPAPAPDPTPTPVPAPTATPVPAPTATPEPEPTATPEPTAVPVIVALNAAADFDGRIITLAGAVDSEEQRQALVDAATAKVGAENVVDNLEVDGSRDADGNDALVGDLAALVGQFGDNLLEGNAELIDDALTYRVLAKDQSTADRLGLAGTGEVDVIEQRAPTFTG